MDEHLVQGPAAAVQRDQRLRQPVVRTGECAYVLSDKPDNSLLVSCVCLDIATDTATDTATTTTATATAAAATATATAAAATARLLLLLLLLRFNMIRILPHGVLLAAKVILAV